ncbi:unnamed protein product [Phytophthora lilii]|uniref:Unnamed protein product n=1 Tax=Phytophthora lilii TaxID=2077276 RepID=A0A9W6TTJ3_9STRA|nr:unnamed protein product [Phytophthora lilii]
MESLSSSSASIVSSVLEYSDHNQQESRSDSARSEDYGEEHFESESDHDHESTALATANLSSTKYESDEFEDEEEDSSIVDHSKAVETTRISENGESNNTEENDYGNESFELEEKDAGNAMITIQKRSRSSGCDIKSLVTNKQNDVPEAEINKEMKSDSALDSIRADHQPELRSWCSKKIEELRTAAPKQGKVEASPRQLHSISDKIPVKAMQRLIRRATASHHRQPVPVQQEKHHYSYNVQVPSSLMHRAQTQRCLATLGEDPRKYQSISSRGSAVRTRPTTMRFCSVMQELLLRKLATLQFEQTAQRWVAPESEGHSLAVLEFVQTMTARQRVAYNVDAGANGPREKMLHRVTAATSLQLEDSVVLRKQAKILLGRVEHIRTCLRPSKRTSRVAASPKSGAMANKPRINLINSDDLSTPPGTPSAPVYDNAFVYKYPEPHTPSLKSEMRIGDPMMEADLKGDNSNNNPSTMFVSLYNQRSSTPIGYVLAAAGVGIGLGILFAHLKLDGAYAKWISMPGDLFIAALKCLIGPMVFCSIVGCIGQLVEAGKAASIGGRVMSYFALCSVVSSGTGVVFGLLFSSFFIQQMKGDESDIVTELRMHCWDGRVLSMMKSGSLACVKDTNATEQTSVLALNDTSYNFATAEESYTSIDVSQQLFAILKEIIPSNMVKAFSSSSTMGVITLAIFFGIAAVMSHERTRRQLAGGSGPAGTTKTDIDVNHLLLLINHGGLVCQLMINAVVTLIPFAIVSMIAGSMAQYTSSTDLVESVGFLIVALALALITLTYGIMGTALFLTTRVNVFAYLRHIIPAQVFIFGCSSSIATLPMTMRCVDSTREVSYALSRFLLPLGATSNLNGSACYMTLACVFMAKVGGYEDLLTPLCYGLLVLVGAIASFGVAPVPHSGLVMAITVWHTVFNMDVPPVFSLLVGADWLLNRMRAIVNITNDTILVRIIAAQCDETTITELALEAQATRVVA